MLMLLDLLFLFFMDRLFCTQKETQKNLCLASSDDNTAQSSLAPLHWLLLFVNFVTQKKPGMKEN